MPPKKFFIKNKTPIFKKTAEYLIIVESPSKCSKIESYLGSNYQCIASKGHLRTIDSLKSINIKNNYHIDFTVIKEKQSHIDFMRSVIIQFPPQNILLASDADREGEAIAWHICDIFNLPIETTPRIIFREITKPALLAAVQQPTIIDMDLVRSQKARQILDIFVGFKISPYLWKHIYSSKKNSLSAGRCQTPCLRLIYDNEKDRKQQVIESVYKTTATFFSNNLVFLLNHEFITKEEVQQFLEESKKHKHYLSICSPKKSINKPPKPFNTSRLLQTASSHLHLSPKQTMALCQILYQEGFITYMRTDSLQYSHEFLNKATEYISNNWGSEYLGSLENLKNNEKLNPHEAIRVTKIENPTIQVSTIDKDPRLNSLYKLIWKNTIESCMSDSTSNVTPIHITAPLNYIYKYSIEIPIFLGWKKLSSTKNNIREQTHSSLTPEFRVSSTPPHLQTLSNSESATPSLNEPDNSSVLFFIESLMKSTTQTLSTPSSSPRQVYDFSGSASSATPPLLQTFSSPSSSQEFSGSASSLTPPLLQTLAIPSKIQSTVVIHSHKSNYSEASLIQKLEELGIGRPSTFSMLVETIQERNYVKKMDLPGESIQCIDFTLEDNIISSKQIDRIFGNEKNKLVIQPIGILTIEFLIKYFNPLFSYDYTKRMEEELDNNINPFSICEECNKNIREQSSKISKIEKQTYTINEEYEVVFQRFGPVLRKTLKSSSSTTPLLKTLSKDKIEYKSIKKDIQLDLEKLKNGEYKINDLIEIENEIIGVFVGEVESQTKEFESKNVYIKSGMYGYYIEWDDKKESIKDIKKPINQIKFEDVLPYILKRYEVCRRGGVADETKTLNSQTCRGVGEVESTKETQEFLGEVESQTYPILENIRKPPSIGKNMLRRINDDISIRKGKFGPYIYYKSSSMGSPQFFKLKGFTKGFQTCDLDEIRTWIRETYNI